ncbi:hypothetical protein GA0115240_159039 [Streptomyces sp. DvalAA-14]|uniref:hypothetical protein n=1 Tax=unclassified Streptomyces TaxID=2593676 RepID=UPI00081B35A6|nr:MULTISPECIES: hypothetical protein [unclassified Streptomyces]SCE41520.1 hypothetical protein GA0115240_159039 [Streptomyces sp. DvalAA-14]
MTDTAPLTEPLIGTHHQSDGYDSHYRHWGPASGEDAIVLLHGGISHSGWQGPLAERVTATSDAASTRWTGVARASTPSAGTCPRSTGSWRTSPPSCAR